MYRPEDRIPSALDRWRITGTLTTQSPMHIGNGDSLKIRNRRCEFGFLDKDADPLFAAVMMDGWGRPLIPGTSLKGALRAWADKHFAGNEELFGAKEGAGCVTFADARFVSGTSPQEPGVRMWCESRWTVLTPQVVIDPRTRSAQDNLLYYVEYVPEGATFHAEFTAQAEDETGHKLLFILENAFRSNGRPARLGADNANGWGQLRWSLTGIKKVDAAAWLRGKPTPWQTALEEVKGEARRNWMAGSKSYSVSTPAEPSVQIALRLSFEGAMLINDPSRQRTGNNAASHVAIRKENGDYYLPAQSVRGSLRAQARRIWQTLAHESPAQNLNRAKRLEAVRADEHKSLAAFLKLFGAAGWRAPVEVGDFRLVSAETPHPQHFIAVDRFTGGVAGSKKFKAEGLWKPQFEGELRVRLDRLEEAETGRWCWLLLAYTLRDWMEGDGTIGFGRSKGYGGFRASVEITGDSADAKLLKRILAREESALHSAEAAEWAMLLDNLLKEAA